MLGYRRLTKTDFEVLGWRPRRLTNDTSEIGVPKHSELEPHSFMVTRDGESSQSGCLAFFRAFS